MHLVFNLSTIFYYQNEEKISSKIHKQKKSNSVVLVVLLFFTLITSTIVSSLPFNNVFAQLGPAEPLAPQGLVNSGNRPSNDIFNISSGYKIEPVLWNLTIPSTVAFDDNGSMYVAESGYSYGGFKPLPRILKVDESGNVTVLVDRQLNGPITDIEFNKKNGVLYVSHRGIISAVDVGGRVKDLIVGLPSTGDHHNNQLALGPDGRLYFGQGTVTNTGVVGDDNYAYEWLKTSPELHDIPGKDITLTGQNFESVNPLTPQNITDYVTTGGFVPFGHNTTTGQAIKGDVKCGGCIISSNINGTDLKMVAWGLRNPYGIAFTEDGKKLIVTNNGADERGSRRIANDSDKILSIDMSNSSNLGNLWYGWPDFFGNAEPVTDPKFKSISSPDNKQPQFLMQNHPPVEKPLALLGEGVAVTQAALSNNSNFGNRGAIFIGEFGTAAPLIHPFADISQEMPGFKPNITGQKVIMLDPNTGNFSDFVSLKKFNKDFRPIGVKFDNKGDALYIVSYGKTILRESVPTGGSGIPGYRSGAGLYPFATIHATVWPYANTGVIWKITPSE
jgi:glucose/arabinose dehydrogenase